MRTDRPEEADLLVQKIPSDIGIHRIARKGTFNAPEKILDGFKFSGKAVVDEVFPDEFDLENTQRRIEDNTDGLQGYGKPLLSVGGDHSVSYPVIQVLKRAHPSLQLVWLDAHLDVKEKVDNHVSHDTVVRELVRHGFSPGDIWFVGVTRIDEDEQEFLEERNFNIYRSDETGEFRREFTASEQPVYLSVDIDVLENVEGTGYPDGKLELVEAGEVIETVESDFADLVEVAPPFDEDGKTVENGRKILEKLVSSLSASR